MDNQDYYGAPAAADSTKILADRLRDLYAPEDFVRVINIDTKPIKYQFTDPSSVETFSDYPGHKDTIMKRPPQVVTLQPGETKLCPAYEADLMIENLIKQIATNKTQTQIDAGTIQAWQSTNWQDPIMQSELIKQIYLGKEDVVSRFNENATNELKAETSGQSRPGRPAKAE